MKKITSTVALFFIAALFTSAGAQLRVIDSLDGFDLQAVMMEFRQKGYSDTEWKGYLDYKKKEYVGKKNGTWQRVMENDPPLSPDELPPCTNMDFEMGNFTGWTGTTGTFAACCPNTGIIANRHTIVTGAGLDPCGGFPVVAPGGSFSVKLGNSTTGAEAEQLMQTFTVTQPLFIYQYACVLEDPQHAATEQPYFKVEVLNALGQPLACGNYSFVAGQGVPGFFNSTTCAGVIYKPWTSVAVDLSLYMGLNVTVKFTTADCSQSGHYGYGYIDGACIQNQITQSNTFCAGGNAQLCAPAGMATYAWSPGGQNTQCITVTAAGTYSVNMTTSSPCPVFPLTKTVTQYPTPVAAVNTTLTSCSACSGTAAANVNGGTAPYTYSWSPAGGNGATATGLCSGSYTLTVATADGCTDTAAFIISNSANLFANPGGQTQASCFGGSNGTATVNPSGGTAPYTYSWNTNPSQTNATATGLSAGSYTATITDANGCTAQNVFTIGQPPVAQAFGSSVNTACNASCTGSANVVMTGGTAPYTYSWSPSGGNSSAVTGLCAGNYTVMVSDVNGCIASNSYTVSQPPPVLANVTGTNPNCSNGTGSAQVTGGGGTPNYNYTWSTGQTTSFINGLTSGTYTVTVKDAKGCTKTGTVTITTPAAITVSATSTNVSCGQNNGTASASPSGGSPAYTYSWSNGQVSSTATGLGAGTYTVTVTDSRGCTNSQTVSVSNANGPVATMSQTNILCNGLCTGSATANVTGGSSPYTYAWSSGQSTSAINNICAGTYTNIVTDNSGCTIIQTVTITQPSLLSVNIFVGSATCGNSNGYATAIVSGGASSYSYLWSNGQTGTTGVAAGLSAGIYSVTVTDGNGCTQTGIAQVNNSNGPQITSSSYTDPLCKGNSDGSASVVVTGTGLSYSWTPPGPNSASVTGLSAGNYTVTVTDSSGCSSFQLFTLSEPPPIVLSTSATPSSCGDNNGSASVNASGGSGIASYAWSPGGQMTSVAAGLFSGTYIVVVTDSNGCTQSASVLVGGTPGPTANTGSDVTILPGEVANLSATGGGTYSWSPSAGLSCDSCANTTASPSQTTEYCVTVTDASGCSDSSCMTVMVEAPCPENITLDLPNAFSPNGDGRNDLFLIAGLNRCVERYSLIVFNRWGEKVFETTALNTSWDGTYRGKKLDPGVFVYYLSAVFTNNQSLTRKGNITLIR